MHAHLIFFQGKNSTGKSEQQINLVWPYNETHGHIGGEGYVALPAYNNIHGIIAAYNVSKFSTSEFRSTCDEYAHLC